MHGLKTASNTAIANTIETTGDLIGDKTTDKIRKISKTSKQSNSEKAKNDHKKKIPRERYISPKKKQKLLMF